jgi:hypothetical protein
LITMSKVSPSLFVIAALFSTALLPAQQAAPKADAAKTSTQSTPEGLTDSQWTSIRAAYEAGRHEVTKVDGTYQARNPGQGWLTRFEDGGFAVKPDSGAWTWGLELKSYGFVGNEQEVGTPSKAQAKGGRMSYRWDALLEEWYINDTRGIEHGYTVQQRPARKTADVQSPLAFTLAVRGGLTAQITEDQRDVRFVDAKGGTALTYTGLTVFDADGKDVPARFEKHGDLLRLLVEEADARYPLTIDPLIQQAYLKASNTDADDRFGSSVTISDDTVVVGAPRESSKATGVNGDQSDNSAGGAGAVYVFVRRGALWFQQAYLKASNTDAGDSFGSSVAISGDTVVVGAYAERSKATGINGVQSDNSARWAGAVYVFARSSGVWTQQAYLKASNTDASDRFGSSVTISGDTVVAGAWGEASSATGVNGVQTNSSALYPGAAYVFVRSSGAWTQQAYLKASNTDGGDYFGVSVSVSDDTVVVGAPYENSNATGVNGDQSDNSASGAGAVYVFVRSSGAWTQQAYLKASNTDAGDGFGVSVSVSDDTVVVGAYYESSNANGNQGNNSAGQSGAAYVFVRSSGVWTQQAYLKASNPGVYDQFGDSVSISGDTLVVGALYEASNATGVNGNFGNNLSSDSGAAYVFARSGGSWIQQAYLKASNTDAGDGFGSSVAISGDTVVVGASYEASNATGVNGDQSDNGAGGAGASYVFELSPAKAVEVGTGCIAKGSPPRLSSTLPVQGTSCQFSVSKAPANAVGVVQLGFPTVGYDFGFGCIAYINPMIRMIPMYFYTDRNGAWTSPPLAVGSSRSLLSAQVALQAGFDSPATAPLGIALSNGVWLTVGY